MMDDAIQPPVEDSTPPTSATKTISSGEISHVVIRGCVRCSGQRVVGEPCATCGNPEPPEVTELGVVSAVYRNPIKRMWWNTVRAPLANRRIRRAGARTLQLRAKGD